MEALIHARPLQMNHWQLKLIFKLLELNFGVLSHHSLTVCMYPCNLLIVCEHLCVSAKLYAQLSIVV